MLCVDPDAALDGSRRIPDRRHHQADAGRAGAVLPLDLRRAAPVPDRDAAVELADEADILRTQIAFGVNKEEVAMVLKPMATDAKEPTFSMGDDTPLRRASAKRPRPFIISSSSASRRSPTRRSTTSVSGS